jgi:hypothetical protein
MALANVHTLHRDPPRFGQDFDHLTPFPFIVPMTGDHLNNITSSNFYFHCTLLLRCKILKMSGVVVAGPDKIHPKQPQSSA